MKILNIEWKMNIPNTLSLMRIVLVPVFVVLYLLSEENPPLLYWSFGVLIFSGVTDSLDGIIARKCNQITELGKLLDPVADKLTQVSVVICLATRYYQVIPLVVICFVKELRKASVALSFCGAALRYGVRPGMEKFPRLCFMESWR